MDAITAVRGYCIHRVADFIQVHGGDIWDTMSTVKPTTTDMLADALFVCGHAAGNASLNVHVILGRFYHGHFKTTNTLQIHYQGHITSMLQTLFLSADKSALMHP